MKASNLKFTLCLNVCTVKCISCVSSVATEGVVVIAGTASGPAPVIKCSELLPTSASLICVSLWNYRSSNPEVYRWQILKLKIRLHKACSLLCNTVLFIFFGPSVFYIMKCLLFVQNCLAPPFFVFTFHRTGWSSGIALDCSQCVLSLNPDRLTWFFLFFQPNSRVIP
jgi:hypothetical protein